MPPETIIRSRHNPIYKQIRSLLRRDRRHQERAFLVEGPRFIADALRFDATPIAIVFSESRMDPNAIRDSVARVVHVFDDELFGSISDTATSQGMLAVFSLPEIAPDPSVTPFIVVADGIQDPGNLGTLLRSSAAAGATKIVVLPGTADPWAPKTVRSAAAAHFLISIEVMSIEQLAATLPAGTLVVGADASADVSYDQIDLTGPVVLLIGSEGNGLSAGARSLAAELVAIPLDGGVESLNAGVAGSVILFEGARQRRKP